MKAIIFAGGFGTRLWPLSRRHSPKQFEKVIGDKSTLQLAVQRLTPDFQWKDIFIATHSKFVDNVKQQLPSILPENVIGEPDSRDVGPAVGLVTGILNKKFPHEPMVILWSDHLIKKIELFKKILNSCEKLIKKKKDEIIFIGQKPRFASQNLGWIHFGDVIQRVDDIDYHAFKSFIYRPKMDEAEQMHKNSTYTWNLGYFVTTPAFLWELYKKHQPEMFLGLHEIYEQIGKQNFQKVLHKVYPTLPKISFDNAILEKIEQDNACVVSDDLGWSDIGAWEALKEALQTSPEKNVTQGKVLLTDCQDSLVYNYTDQLTVAIDVEGMLVINTHDVVLVCHKNSVPKIKKLVEKLAESENNHLI
jgi:mannose-1-phosphate guanylyltransferase